MCVMKDEAARQRIAAQLEKHYPGLVNLFVKAAGSRHLAQDIVNDAIVKLLEHVDEARLSDLDNIAGYVFQTAYRLLANHRRKKENQASLREDPRILDQLPQPGPEEQHEIEEICANINEILEDFSERDRAVLVAYYHEGQDTAEICAKFGLSPDQLKKILFRAKRRLIELLKKKRGE